MPCTSLCLLRYHLLSQTTVHACAALQAFIDAEMALFKQQCSEVDISE